jgi:hypothetical protein
MKDSANVRKPEPEDKCDYCGTRYDFHRNGFCYYYSDESEDYFYKDKKFTRNEPAMEKETIIRDTTKRPWHQSKTFGWNVMSREGVVCSCEKHEDAELIVKAVNSHDRNEAITSELVEALKARKKRHLEFQKTINVPPGWIQKEIDFLQSLITKAEQLKPPSE